MLSILLLTGGTSSERAVSLRSGAAAQAALESSGHRVTAVDMAEPVDDQLFAGYDVIFPMIHGAGGEDGVLQARLESLGYRNFVGSDAAASELCFDKWRYRQSMQAEGVPMAEGAMVTAAELSDHPLAQKPFVLKPAKSGSSVDTFIVRNSAAANFEAMAETCDRYGVMLLENLIEGVEITVGVLGDESLPVIEIIPPSDGEFDYENKYNGLTRELCPPENLSLESQTQARELALKIHRLCSCRDLSRTDMIITADGSIFVLETNTIPGMTDQSLLPKAAAATGITMVELCDRLVQLAASRQ